MSSLDPRNMKRMADRLVGAKINKLGRAAGVEVAARLIRKTPVKEGVARGNWNASIDAMDASWSPTRTDRQGHATLAKASNTAQRMKFFDGQTFYMTNAVPYIQVLDDGRRMVDGKLQGSIQSPDGMSRPTIREMEPTIKRIGARLRREVIQGG